MKKRKIPMRTCVITKEKLEKCELLRVVKTSDDKVSVDKSGRANGRGAYLKKDKNVVARAKKNKVLDRVLEVSISEDIYEELMRIIEDGGEIL